MKSAFPMNFYTVTSTVRCGDAGRRIATHSRCRLRTPAWLALLLLLHCPAASALGSEQPTGRVFARPQDAVSALDQAVNSTNRAGLLELFGPDSESLVNSDVVQGAQERANFATAFKVHHELVPGPASNLVLEVGADHWPFPIPLVKRTNGWQFDTQAGLDELLNRRVGRNELEALSTMRAYVGAQRDYASRDRNGDEVLAYAQKITSSPGQMDGLYWPPDLNGELSPFGPLMAEAQGEGYFKESRAADAGPQPFHGYLFKILVRQGKHAPGGKYDYIINGNMIGGFALVAWPADYGQSGIMTFIVNQQGRVYQKDLGDGTTKLAEKLTVYDPDSTWKISPD